MWLIHITFSASRQLHFTAEQDWWKGKHSTCNKRYFSFLCSFNYDYSKMDTLEWWALILPRIWTIHDSFYNNRVTWKLWSMRVEAIVMTWRWHIFCLYIFYLLRAQHQLIPNSAEGWNKIQACAIWLVLKNYLNVLIYPNLHSKKLLIMWLPIQNSLENLDIKNCQCYCKKLDHNFPWSILC